MINDLNTIIRTTVRPYNGLLYNYEKGKTSRDTLPLDNLFTYYYYNRFDFLFIISESSGFDLDPSKPELFCWIQIPK